MSDTLITVVAIMLAATLIFVVPLVTTSQRVDDVSQLDVETLTSNFVDEIRTTGKLTLNDYEKFLEALTSTGNTYDVSMEFKILDENPGKKSTQTTKDKIGENVYYSLFTTQIEESLEKEEMYNLKQGDMIYVTVRNTNLTTGQQIKDTVYKIVGNDTYTIIASKSGLVIGNGSTSVVLSDNDANENIITYTLRENDASGTKLGVDNWTNQNVYVEFSKQSSYNLDLFYYWRYARSTEDYTNGYTQLESNNVVITEKSTIQAYWKSSALEKYSNIENININIDRISPTIGSVSGSNVKVNTGTISISGVTDTGGSGIYGYTYKWTEPNEEPTAPTKDLENWTKSSATIFTIIANPENNGKKCTVWIRDKAGNISEGKSVVVKNVVPKITSVTLENKILKKDENINIGAKIEGGNDYPSIVYTSSNTSAVTIDSNGNITAVAPGTSTITCTITNYDGSQVTSECIVTVVNLTYTPNGGIFTYNTSKNANGQYYSVIKSTVKVEGATTSQYAWSKSDTTEPTEWTNYNTTDGGIVIKTEANTTKEDVTYYLWTKITDIAGNKVIYVSKSFKIISSFITITPNKTYWTNQNVICTITYPDLTTASTRKAGYGSTLADAKTVANSAIGPTTSVIATANGYVYAIASDLAGNQVTASFLITNIDKTGPTVPTIIYNSGRNACAWQNNINITLSSTDTQTQVAYYEIDWNGDGVVDTTTGSNFIPWNGYNSCNNRFRAVDSLENRGGWSSAIHIHQDTQSPAHINWWFGYGDTDKITLYIQVSDNIGVQKVQCPTSTSTGGYNNWVWIDAVWDANANAYRADISPSTWGHYNTTYLTHLYIYDHAGNGGYYNQATMAIGNPVAAIGSTYYSTLGKAIDRVSSGGTITMINNTTEYLNIPSEKTITLNLNSKTITGYIYNWGTLNISNGTITLNGAGWTLTNYNTMNISNVNINYSNQDTGTALMNQGYLTMNGGSVYSGSHSLVNRGGTAIVRNATITGVTRYGVWSEAGARSEFYYCNINSLSNGDKVGNGQVFVINTNVDYIYPDNPVVSIGISGNDLYISMYAASQYQTVKFPTWSVVNGQDDLIWYTSVESGGYFSSAGHYLSSHSGYQSGLAIHIYLYPGSIAYGGITLYEW